MKISSRRNLCGQIVHDLGRQILAGEIPPGEALPQETVLCEQMGVSRTVIREAIKSLAAKGLVESKAKKGTIVQPFRSWNYFDPDVLEWHTQSDINGQQLPFLTEFRQAIEPAAAAMAAVRASQEELDEISSAFIQMEKSTESVEAFLVSDVSFHTAILHATGNPFFAPVANVISASLESSLRVTNRQPVDNRQSVPIHKKVKNAICNRDPTAAEQAMQFLLNDAMQRIESAFTDSTGNPSDD